MCSTLLPLHAYTMAPSAAWQRMAEAIAKMAEEVDDGLDARHEHEHWAQHASGHRHDRRWLHGLALSDLISLQRWKKP